MYSKYFTIKTLRQTERVASWLSHIRGRRSPMTPTKILDPILIPLFLQLWVAPVARFHEIDDHTFRDKENMK